MGKTADDLLGTSPDDTEFFEAMSGERDPMVFVIRGAAYLESETYRYIHSRVAKPAAFDKLGLEFYQAVGVAEALGFDPDVAKAVRAVAKIRNSFAHNPSPELSQANLNDLWNTLSARDKELTQQGWRKVRSDSRPLPRAEEVAEAFCFIVVCLRACIKYERVARLGV